jgi:hypothetical protein
MSVNDMISTLPSFQRASSLRSPLLDIDHLAIFRARPAHLGGQQEHITGFDTEWMPRTRSLTILKLGLENAATRMRSLTLHRGAGRVRWRTNWRRDCFRWRNSQRGEALSPHALERALAPRPRRCDQRKDCPLDRGRTRGKLRLSGRRPAGPFPRDTGLCITRPAGSRW